MSEELKERIRVAITDKETAEELIALLESQSAAQAAINADFEARIAALE